MIVTNDTTLKVAIFCAARLIYYMTPGNSGSDNVDAQQRDANLFRRIRNDDMDALAELMDIHSARLMSVAEITCGSFDLAREAIQDAFFHVWEKRHSLDLNTRIAGYLVMTARHRALDLLRHEQMHGRTSTELTRIYTSAEPFAYNEGEFAAEREEAKAVLQKALSEVQPRAREIFLLHREAGLSYEEIEKLLGVSYGTIRLQMSRAATHVGQALRNWLSGKPI